MPAALGKSWQHEHVQLAFLRSDSSQLRHRLITAFFVGRPVVLPPFLQE
jgi:hypothetical protein